MTTPSLAAPPTPAARLMAHELLALGPDLLLPVRKVADGEIDRPALLFLVGDLLEIAHGVAEDGAEAADMAAAREAALTWAAA